MGTNDKLKALIHNYNGIKKKNGTKVIEVDINDFCACPLQNNESSCCSLDVYIDCPIYIENGGEIFPADCPLRQGDVIIKLKSNSQ